MMVASSSRNAHVPSVLIPLVHRASSGERAACRPLGFCRNHAAYSVNDAACREPRAGAHPTLRPPRARANGRPCCHPGSRSSSSSSTEAAGSGPAAAAPPAAVRPTPAFPQADGSEGLCPAAL